MDHPLELWPASGPRTLVIHQAKVGDIVHVQMPLALFRRHGPAAALNAVARRGPAACTGRVYSGMCYIYRPSRRLRG